MDTIIFLPGGGGSRLALRGQEIWPPYWWEFITGYTRLQQFLDPGATATGIVDAIPLGIPILRYEVYQPLLDDLNFIAQAMNRQSFNFPYDFRKNDLLSARRLAAFVERCVNEGSEAITLVCHSTGNLVARALLEGGIYSNRTWFSKIGMYVGICGPHFGVPSVLEYGLGLDGWLSISSTDMKSFSTDHRYPGCYQLFPFPGYNVLMDVRQGSQNFYIQAIANRFALDWKNIVKARSLQKKLSFNQKPPGVQYAIVAASEQLTDQTIEYDGQNCVGIRQDYSGDGTVPLWSSAPGQLNPYVTPGDHIGVLKVYPFRQILYDILTGGTINPP